MKLSQTAWVGAYLKKHGTFTRNQALKNGITRLAARIQDLKDADWEISGAFVKTRNGKDYVYTLIKQHETYITRRARTPLLTF